MIVTSFLPLSFDNGVLYWSEKIIFWIILYLLLSQSVSQVHTAAWQLKLSFSGQIIETY